MPNFRTWFGQVTTGHGAMILAPTLLAVMSGSMIWQTALPLLVAGTVGLAWPENAALKDAAQALTADATRVYGASMKPGPAAGFVLAVALAGILGACANGSGPTPKAGVLSMEAALTAADGLAVNYVRLPACTGATGPLCSDPPIVAQIKRAGATAYRALTAAQTAVDADPAGAASATSAALTDARAALAAFQGVVSTLPKGN